MLNVSKFFIIILFLSSCTIHKNLSKSSSTVTRDSSVATSTDLKQEAKTVDNSLTTTKTTEKIDSITKPDTITKKVEPNKPFVFENSSQSIEGKYDKDGNLLLTAIDKPKHISGTKTTETTKKNDIKTSQTTENKAKSTVNVATKSKEKNKEVVKTVKNGFFSGIGLFVFFGGIIGIAVWLLLWFRKKKKIQTTF